MSAAQTIHPATRLRGRIEVPGDKSISHRYAILAALAEGTSRLAGYAPGADCAATLACLEALGVSVRRGAPDAGALEIDGRGPRGLRAPSAPLDARNSGTTMRLLAGVLAAHPFESILEGDASLSRRPMRRVIEPLSLMGANVSGTAQDRPPLRIRGGTLRGIDYRLPVASAQVKSAVLLAGLQAEGTTIVHELAPTRDHTERAFEAFGVHARIDGPSVAVRGGQRPSGQRLTVPGDASSAAFFGVAAAALPGSDLLIAGVGLNPTRSGWIEVLKRAGARIDVEIEGESAGEPSGSIRVRHGALAPIEILPAQVPPLIDELPALAALATHGGSIVVTGASELRAKESDRIAALVAGLRALGADAEELPDGFVVRARGRLAGGRADAAGDHRLAMAFAIAALGARGPCAIAGAGAVSVSYPGFFAALESLRQ
ncbi:MAG TPA: 3-phosphoshikimate 1-carboxyvinyltransferase [Vicinamibacterales bacterium]|nr:3-phosphoshikimate 1-carboxyvinyltransferase [Vicinamibacterales bacterium]